MYLEEYCKLSQSSEYHLLLFVQLPAQKHDSQSYMKIHIYCGYILDQPALS